jgi:hypothetical protein
MSALDTSAVFKDVGIPAKYNFKSSKRKQLTYLFCRMPKRKLQCASMNPLPVVSLGIVASFLPASRTELAQLARVSRKWRPVAEAELRARYCSCCKTTLSCRPPLLQATATPLNSPGSDKIYLHASRGYYPYWFWVSSAPGQVLDPTLIKLDANEPTRCCWNKIQSDVCRRCQRWIAGSPGSTGLHCDECGKRNILCSSCFTDGWPENMPWWHPGSESAPYSRCNRFFCWYHTSSHLHSTLHPGHITWSCIH